jgi:hypothetical protein
MKAALLLCNPGRYAAPRNGSRLLVFLPVDEAGEHALTWLAEQAVILN